MDDLELVILAQMYILKSCLEERLIGYNREIRAGYPVWYKADQIYHIRRQSTYETKIRVHKAILREQTTFLTAAICSAVSANAKCSSLSGPARRSFDPKVPSQLRHSAKPFARMAPAAVLIFLQLRRFLSF